MSALAVGVEVTVKPKDRESPIKNRKRDQKEHKEPVKEVPTKENVPEKLTQEEDKQSDSLSTIQTITKELKELSVMPKEMCDEKKVQRKEKVEMKVQSVPTPEHSETPDNSSESATTSYVASSDDNGKYTNPSKLSFMIIRIILHCITLYFLLLF